MRSGIVYLAGTAGTLRYAGLYADYWSSRGGAATTAYSLAFHASTVDPSSGPHIRYYGFPLRCLSTVLGMWRRNEIKTEQNYTLELIVTQRTGTPVGRSPGYESLNPPLLPK